MIIDETSEVIKSMLCQNTGRPLLDNFCKHLYEINKEKNLFEEPAFTLKYKYGSISKIFSLFHFLNDRLIYEPRLDRIWQGYANKNPNLPYVPLLLGFLPWLGARCPKGSIKTFGEDADNGHLYYTYNSENCLSQDFQCLHFEQNGNEYAIVSSHNGGDARYGMSFPIAFEVREKLSLFQYNDWTIFCENEHYWGDGKNENVLNDIDRYPVLKEEDGHIWKEHHLFVKENEDILCPECGVLLALSCP
jgi:hypothetical protein